MTSAEMVFHSESANESSAATLIVQLLIFEEAS
jgi:hypothetical protein